MAKEPSAANFYTLKGNKSEKDNISGQSCEKKVQLQNVVAIKQPSIQKTEEKKISVDKQQQEDPVPSRKEQFKSKRKKRKGVSKVIKGRKKRVRRRRKYLKDNFSILDL